MNDPFARSFGLAPDDLVGKNVYDIYPRELAMKYEKDSREVMAAGTRIYFEESSVDQEGKIQYLEKIETPIFNDTGAVIGIIGIAHDITSRKEVEVTLRHDSTHDMLTGLYNRAYFDEELERLAHGRMFPMSVVMADINGLKTVNDTLGHEAGDNLIRLAARLIMGAFRADEIVARIGGDEFAVLLPGTDNNVAEKAVKRIMRSPEIINGQVSIAFGIASAESKDQLAEALKLSDERMYRDKTGQFSDRSTFHCFLYTVPRFTKPQFREATNRPQSREVKPEHSRPQFRQIEPQHMGSNNTGRRLNNPELNMEIQKEGGGRKAG